MQNRLRTAKLSLSASIEDLDFKDARGMNRSQVMSFAQNQWSEYPCHWTNRCWRELSCLCTCTEGVSGWTHHSLPETAPIASGHLHCPPRWSLSKAHGTSHQMRSAGSQLPIKAWHDAMQDPTLADAILDRLVHNAYKVELKGESMRKKRTMLDQKTVLMSDSQS